MSVDRDWQDQIRHSIRTVDGLREYVHLSAEEAENIRRVEGAFSWWITPYYARLMDKDDPDCPIRKQVVPHIAELHDPLGVIDPLEEEKHNPALNVIKVYPDRIAWCVANRCASLCRHCLRKRMVGRENFDFSPPARRAALDYIAATPEIRHPRSLPRRPPRHVPAWPTPASRWAINRSYYAASTTIRER